MRSRPSGRRPPQGAFGQEGVAVAVAEQHRIFDAVGHSDGERLEVGLRPWYSPRTAETVNVSRVRHGAPRSTTKIAEVD
jgi:hypothetical protein